MNKRYLFLTLMLGLFFSTLLCFGGITSDTVNIDFGMSDRLSNSTSWNNLYDNGYDKGSSIALHTSKGNSMVFDLNVTSRFYYYLETGDTADASLGIPLSASLDGFWGAAKLFNGLAVDNSTIVFRGLSSSTQYSFVFYCSRHLSSSTTVDNRETQYKVIGTTTSYAYLDAFNNKTKVATVSNITPVGDSITIVMTAGPNNTNANGFFYINALRMIYASSEAPTVPTGLMVNSKSASSVSLSWKPSTDDVGVAGYFVYKDGSLVATVTDTTATISGLSSYTSYLFTVKAFDADKNLTEACSLAVTTLDGTAPTTPTSLSRSNITSSGFTLSWSGSTDNVAVTGYKIYLDGALVQTVTGTTAILCGLADATTYTMTVKAVDAAGNLSDAASLSVTTPDGTAPAAPANLSSSNISSSGFTLNWNSSTDNVAVTGYEIYQNGTFVQTVTGTTASLSGLSNVTTYSMTVKAVDAAGNLSDAASLNVTTLDGTAPTAPTNFSSSEISLTQFTLSWDKSTDNVAVVGYTVYKDNDSVAYSTNTSVVITGLAENTSYSMTVKAVDAAGNRSSASSVLSVKTSKSTGVDEIAKVNIKIYPNPATTFINIEVADNGILSIINNSGVPVLNKALKSGFNSVEFNLPLGVYVIKYVSETNGIFTDKIIVK
jgi:chitodextrinase